MGPSLYDLSIYSKYSSSFTPLHLTGLPQNYPRGLGPCNSWQIEYEPIIAFTSSESVVSYSYVQGHNPNRSLISLIWVSMYVFIVIFGFEGVGGGHNFMDRGRGSGGKDDGGVFYFSFSFW